MDGAKDTRAQKLALAEFWGLEDPCVNFGALLSGVKRLVSLRKKNEELTKPFE